MTLHHLRRAPDRRMFSDTRFEAAETSRRMVACARAQPIASCLVGIGSSTPEQSKGWAQRSAVGWSCIWLRASSTELTRAANSGSGNTNSRTRLT